MRQRAHLTLSTAELLGSGPLRRASQAFAYGVAAAVVAALSVGSWRFVQAEREAARTLPGGIPEWVSELVMPVALALLALRFVWAAGASWKSRVCAALLMIGALALGAREEPIVALGWPLAALVVLAVLLGAPMSVAMAGLAVVFFWRDAVPVAAVSAEVYRLIASPTLPAIPLFTAAGYILAEGKSAVRLVRFFQAVFGWMPGGIPIAMIAVAALVGNGAPGSRSSPWAASSTRCCATRATPSRSRWARDHGRQPGPALPAERPRHPLRGGGRWCPRSHCTWPGSCPGCCSSRWSGSGACARDG